jgi:hypothetical protein
MVEHFDGIGSFKGSSFEKCAELLSSRGFAFDYISDKQLWETDVDNGLLTTSGDGVYKLIVIPQCAYIPLRTMEKLLQIAKEGGQILFVDKMPAAVSGLGYLEERKARFDNILSRFDMLSSDEGASRKTVQVTDNLGSALMVAGVRRESMIDLGIQCLRKKNPDDDVFYFVRNASAKPYEGWLPLSVSQRRMMTYDPMSGRSGRARSQVVNSRMEVFAQLAPGQTLIIASESETDVEEFVYREMDGTPFLLQGVWHVTFETGGPELPAAFQTDSLVYWTAFKDDPYRNFSGTATYQLTFERPVDRQGRWLLQLDSVGSSVEVILNGKTIGTLIGPPFEVEFEGELLRDSNDLQLKVSNLMANRISYMDRNNIFWKKFYNVNFPARRRENARNNIFNASHWPPRPSGISGKAKLYPLK